MGLEETEMNEVGTKPLRKTRGYVPTGVQFDGSGLLHL